MVHVAALHRHPLKGFTAEQLECVQVQAKKGFPLDRHFALTGGKNNATPIPGGWVLSRTYLILTTHPELAKYQATLLGNDTLNIKTPDGETASATLGHPDTFLEIEELIAREFPDGPNGPPRLIEQAAGRGHWDFTDTDISIINLATVRAISAAINKPLELERFRGNVYIDGLAAWEEFSWPGRQITIGDVCIDIRRPIQRCAMTSTEPGTGKRDINLPVSMNKLFGHGFCGVYANVANDGRISTSDSIHVSDTLVNAPYENLPDNAAPVPLWPRFSIAKLHDDGTVKLEPEIPDWPLPEASPGMLLNALANSTPSRPAQWIIKSSDPSGYVCETGTGKQKVPSRILLSGPFGTGKNATA